MSPRQQTTAAATLAQPMESTKSKKRKAGRRRRGRKDVILDFSSRASTRKSLAGHSTKPTKTITANFTNKQTPSISKPPANDDIGDQHEELEDEAAEATGNKKRRGKLLLTTSSKDYDGNLGLPDKVGQRQYETTGQFLRRLDRLVAKAKVEANLESRFDINLMEKSSDMKKQKKSAATPVDLASSSRYGDKRRKRYGR